MAAIDPAQTRELWVPPMATDTAARAVSGSPWWWLSRLERKLDEQARWVALFSDYYDGKHRLAFATSKFREAFGRLFSAFADNWCDLVVDAAVERLRVQGFRFGGQGEPADKDAWTIWQANGLDADSLMLHTEAVKCGEAALIVEPGDDPDIPRITVEHPAQVIVENESGARRRRAAALKRWIDSDGHWWATVYLPGFVYRFRSVSPASTAQRPRWVERPRVPFEQRTGLDVVPVIPMRNNPHMLLGGRSDLAKAIPVQDAINKLCTDMIVASEFYAFRQRVMTGVEVPTDPVTGQPIADWKLAITRLFTVSDENVKVFDLEASDLGNYVKGIELLTQHFSAQNRLPPHYMIGRIVNAAAEALKAAETGLVARVGRMKLDFSDPWEDGMRLTFRLRGQAGDDERARATDAETIWADSESRTEAEHVDAAVKKQSIGIPQQIIWEDLGYSPQQIQRMQTMQAEQSLRAGTMTFDGDPLANGADSEPAQLAARALSDATARFDAGPT